MGLGALLRLGWDGRAELARGGGGARFADLGGSRKRRRSLGFWELRQIFASSRSFATLAQQRGLSIRTQKIAFHSLQRRDDRPQPIYSMKERGDCERTRHQLHAKKTRERNAPPSTT